MKNLSNHKSLIFFIALAICFNGLFGNPNARVMAAPTDGFTQVSLSSSNFQLQKPYDKAAQDRYSNINGVENMWLYSTDKPFKPDSDTKPRTEIRISGYDYTSGVWQFEGNFYVPNGTTGACIMQVFGAVGQSTTLQLRVYDGDLKVYNSQVAESNIYNRWIKVNVIHDVGNSMLTVFVNNVQKVVVGGQGLSEFYFKYGVYAQTGSSNYMESMWSGIKVFRLI